MKKRSLISSKRQSGPRPISAVRTGDHCPTSGWWAPDRDAQARQFVSEGSLMPTSNGTATSWMPVREVTASPANQDQLAGFRGQRASPAFGP